MDTNADLLAEMHTRLISDLLTRIKSGEATPQDRECARKLLHDNGIEARPGAGNVKELALAESLPFNTEDRKTA